MKLSKLLNGITVSKMFYLKYGQFVVTQDLEINCIRYDSRKVQNGDIFVAIRGAEFDGHNFIKNAVSNGASVVVLEDDSILNDSFFLHSGVMKIVVPNSRIALAKLSANYFNNPSERLSIFGLLVQMAKQLQHIY
jgi:UDP-N-acetylmuramoyl-L-alanyl-D-glutamate--2,6-diaminopimelate ligase